MRFHLLMFDWFRRMTRREGWLEASGARRRMRPSQVRLYTPADFEDCVELYRLNEPNRFPAEDLPNFEKALHAGNALRFVIEEGGSLLGCGAVQVQNTERGDFAVLSYGLVHPQWHGRGIGSTLLVARIAVIPKEIPVVALMTVPASRSFYESYGFCQRASMNVRGAELPLCYARICPDDIQYCQSLLARAGVKLPAHALNVPVIVEDGGS